MSRSKVLLEKYLPKTLDELLLPQRMVSKLSQGIYQHFLFHGHQGTGKSKTALALVKHFDHPFKYINASLETSVDVIRNEITDFCTKNTLTHDPSKTKVVILDEIDGVSDQFFKALRGTMDQFSKVRFIATCNFVQKVPPPVLSRFEVINFEFPKDEENEIKIKYAKRLKFIADQESITIEPKALASLVKENFPDFRSMLVTLESCSREGEITFDKLSKFRGEYSDVYSLIFNTLDPASNYKLIVSNYSSEVDDVLSSLGDEFITYIIKEKNSYVAAIPEIIIAVAKYQSMRIQVIDPVVSLLACIYEIQSIIKKA